MNEQNIAGNFFIGETELGEQRADPFAQSGPVATLLTEQRFREIVADAVHKSLSPDAGAIDPRRFARVSFVTDQGEEWRGMVYPVERTE